jgi:cytochrome P450
MLVPDGDSPGHVARRSRGAPLLGLLPALRRDPLATLSRLRAEQGDAARLQLGPRFGGRVAHLLVHPDHLMHVLVTERQNFQLSASYEVLRLVLGDSLLTTHGPDWVHHRRVAQPTFHAERLTRVTGEMIDAGTACVSRLIARGGRADPVDVAAEMAVTTLDAVGRAMFDTATAQYAPTIAPALRTIQEFAIRTVYSPAYVVFGPSWLRLPTPTNRERDRAVTALMRVADELIAERFRRGLEGDDLLGGLLAARHPSDDLPWDAQAIRDEVLTFLLAGHETTAAALTWTLGLLALHPEERDRVQAELDRSISGDGPAPDELEDLVVLDAVIAESLRLMPPAWLLERTAGEDDRIQGHAVAAGDQVLMSPYLTHRHPEFWPEPDRFRPDRFLGERTQHRLAYLPFGAGPRRCIGGGFATLEIKAVLAAILHRLDLNLAPGASLRPVPQVTLTPGDGLQMTVRDRRG